MIQITVSRPDGVAGAPNPIMTAFGKSVPFTCFVRNEVNGLRAMNEVVYSVKSDGSQGPAIMPRTFPVGTWELKMPAPRSNPLLAPYFIPTTAWQVLDEWEVENRGTASQPEMWYVQKTGRQVQDFAYGIHCSTAHESWGCIHVVDDPSGRRTKFEYLDELVNDLINWLKDPTMAQPPELQVVAV
jgi:hypothetical protein